MVKTSSTNSHNSNQNNSSRIEGFDDTGLISSNKSRQLPAAVWWQKKSIHFKATVLAIAIGTVPTTLLGLVAYSVANNSIAQEITAARKILVKDLQSELNLFMGERFKDIQIMANLDIFTNPQLSKSTSKEEKAVALAKMQAIYGIYNSIGVFDLKGNAIAQTGTKPLGNHLNRGYIQAALNNDRAVLSQPRISTSSGIYSVYAAAPIKDKVTGQTIGVIRARMPVAVLKELLQDYTREGDRYYLLDRDGTVFLGSKGEYVIQTLSNDRTAAEKPQSSYQALGIEKVFSGVSQLLTSNQLITQDSAVNLETNQKEFIAFAPSEEFDETDLHWQALITTDRGQVFAPQRRLKIIYLVGTIAIAILTGVVAYYLAKLATRPILVAAQTIDEIGEGNLEARITVKGQDELAHLANNINGMALQLEEFVLEQYLFSQQTEILKKAVLALNTATTEEAVWQIAADRGRAILQVDGVSYYDLEKQQIVAESIDSGIVEPIDREMYEAEWIANYVAKNCESTVSIIEEILQAQLPTSQLDKLKNAAIRGLAIARIGKQGSPIGLLIARQSISDRSLQQSEIDFFEQIANQVSLTLDRLDFVRQQEAAQIRERRAKEELQLRALELSQQVDGLSQGDLTIRAKVTEDEIGTIADSYNATIHSLHKLVTQVKTAAAEVEHTASTNQTIIQQLATDATSQTQSITLTMQQIQKMTQSIGEVSQNASQAEVIVKEANQTILAGDTAMDRTVNQINALQTTVNKTEQKVKLLGESSQEISQVVNSIGRFAAQTHLLALKASIEAARAGEQGKGFATIADEVRSLATQSATATTDIENLVARIQLETNEVISAMTQGKEQVNFGTESVKQTRQSLKQVTIASKQISDLIANIAQSAQGQSMMSHEVSDNIKNVAISAQANSQSATQVSVEIEQLLALANQLQADIDRFKT